VVLQKSTMRRVVTIAKNGEGQTVTGGREKRSNKPCKACMANAPGGRSTQCAETKNYRHHGLGVFGVQDGNNRPTSASKKGKSPTLDDEGRRAKGRLPLGKNNRAHKSSPQEKELRSKRKQVSYLFPTGEKKWLT